LFLSWRSCHSPVCSASFSGFGRCVFFGCWVLPPATALLVYIACRHRGRVANLDSPYTWIVQGAMAGVVAAGVYDLYRLPFVLSGAPLF
jgi:hypothetical protein